MDTDLVPLAEPGDVAHVSDIQPLGGLTVATLDIDTDVDTLHAWVNATGAEFYDLAGVPRDELADIYRTLADDDTHRAFLMRLDNEPTVLVQLYDPAAFPVVANYDHRPGDCGLHLLVGTRSAPGATMAMLRELAAWALDLPDVERLVVEPAADNHRAIARAERLGFTFGEVVPVWGKHVRVGILSPGRADRSRG